MGYFRKSCLTNVDKIQNFVTLKMGVTIFNGAFCSLFVFLENVVNVLLSVVVDMFAYFGTYKNIIVRSF